MSSESNIKEIRDDPDTNASPYEEESSLSASLGTKIASHKKFHVKAGLF
jgi:hypothetical protein